MYIVNTSAKFSSTLAVTSTTLNTTEPSGYKPFRVISS